MSFDDLLDQTIALLQKRGRLTYRALRRQFQLDDDLLEDLVFELIEGQRVATDEGGAVLVWNGAAAAPPSGAPASSAPAAPAQSRSIASSKDSTYTPKHLTDSVFKGRTATEGEIKQVTVVFCDIVRSTELADRIGPEEMHNLLNSFFELSLAAVHTYEGTINQFLGDGFMALFGAPVSHEDHARRAVRAAVKLRETLHENRDELGGALGAELSLRIGVNSGKVVVGGIGDNLRMDYTAVGDTSNVAARLQALAEPGEILISESVAFQVRGDTNLEALPPREVKGKAQPIAAYRVLGVRRPHRGPIDLRGGRSLSPFVGREAELRRMLDIAACLEEGRGHVVALSAEAGVGKSRLAHEFREKVAAGGRAFFEGRCVSFEHSTPYRPLADVLREAAGISEADEPEVIGRKTRAYLKSRQLSASEWSPFLLRLFGVEAGTETLDALSPEAIRARTNQMFVRLTQQASRLRPLVVLIEDLHWVDSASEACLGQMIEVAADHPVLFVFTYRPSYKPAWLDRSDVTHLNLRRLPAEDGKSLISAVVAQALLSEEVLATILAKAEGVPFFLEELTRSVLESGETESGGMVPATIEGVITARIDRLPELTKRLLQAAAVLGRQFTVGLLRDVWTESRGVEPLLAELRDLAFIKREEGALEPTYVFVHALTQDVAYGCILTSRRRTIHEAAGLALERQHVGRLDDVLDRLAYHFSRTHNAEKAVQYLRTFAGRASRGYANAEAARALQEALEHVERLDAGVRDATRLEIAHELANSLYFLGRFPDMLELLEGLEPVVERLGDPRLAGVHHFHLGHTCSYVGRMPGAFEHARKAIEYAKQCGDKLTEGRAAYVMERASFWTGRFPDAIDYAKQAIAALEETDERWWEAQSLWMIGWSHGAMGQFVEALDAEDRTRAIGEAIEDPRLPCYAAWTSAVMLAMRGDTDEAIAAGQHGLEKSTDLLNTGVAWGFTGFAHLEAGNPEEAIPLLQKGAERMEEMRFRPLHGWFTIWWGHALLLQGDADGAEDMVRKGMDVCDEIKNWWGLGMGQRILGRIAFARDDLDGADQHLDQAEETFAPIHARYWEARVHLDKAEVAHAKGIAMTVAAELQAAQEIFTALPCEHWSRETESFARTHDIPLEATG